MIPTSFSEVNFFLQYLVLLVDNYELIIMSYWIKEF
jgi:hypothetical protein